MRGCRAGIDPAAGPAVGSGLRGCNGWSGGRVDAAGVGAAGTGNFGSGVRRGAAGVAGAEGAGAEEVAGICMTLPQVGHFPFLPAAASGALIVVLHVEQLNLIVIRKPFPRHIFRRHSRVGAPLRPHDHLPSRCGRAQAIKGQGYLVRKGASIFWRGLSKKNVRKSQIIGRGFCIPGY